MFSVGRWYEVGSIPCNIVVVYVYVCIYVSYTYFLAVTVYFFLKNKIFFCSEGVVLSFYFCINGAK